MRRCSPATRNELATTKSASCTCGCTRVEPQADELAVAVKHLEKAPDEKLAFEDILWALVNTKEFLFNH